MQGQAKINRYSPTDFFSSFFLSPDRHPAFRWIRPSWAEYKSAAKDKSQQNRSPLKVPFKTSFNIKIRLVIALY